MATATSFATPNFSGMLFRKGIEKTPFSTIIGSRPITTNHVAFTCGQYYQAVVGSQPAISETDSLTAPTANVITRQQLENVTQIFMESVSVSYAKLSNMGTMSGINVAGQQPNPMNEETFQIERAMAKIAMDIEYTFLNGAYQKAADDVTANKSRGMLTAITTNVLDVTPVSGTGPMLTRALLNQLIVKIADQGGDVTNLVLGVPAAQIAQLDLDAIENKMTQVTQDREINGIAVKTIITPYGNVSVKMFTSMPAGTALLFDPENVHPVFQPTPGKGNFFLEPLAKKGAADESMIFGQVGLDHGPEWLSGKIIGLSTAMPGTTNG